MEFINRTTTPFEGYKIMAHIEINSFFTRGGIPATNIDDLNPHPDGKSYPRTRIWEISGSVYNLVVGDVIGTGQNSDGIMSSLNDTSVEDGFYTFLFEDIDGYDITKKYLVRCDGGPSLPASERYQVAHIHPAEGAVAIGPVDIENIANAVWDETATDHLLPGSMGLFQNEMHADVQQLRIDMTSALSLLSTLLKYEQNRTKIDKVAKTLTIYENDGVTVLKVFDLKDSTGAPSVTEVCERVPV